MPMLEKPEETARHYLEFISQNEKRALAESTGFHRKDEILLD
jgi:hypothetical protein